MGKNIKIFEHAELGDIRVIQGEDTEPWFVAKDVCGVLGIKYTHIAIGYLDEDEWITSPDTDVKGGIQDKFIVNESGMYSLILRSRKPEAKKCRKWVTSEVLPIIRKHGIYATEDMVEKMLSDPSTMIKTLERLRDEHEKRVEAGKVGSDSFY
jgi:prophage antirepressor-like protein